MVRECMCFSSSLKWFFGWVGVVSALTAVACGQAVSSCEMMVLKKWDIEVLLNAHPELTVFARNYARSLASNYLERNKTLLLEGARSLGRASEDLSFVRRAFTSLRSWGTFFRGRQPQLDEVEDDDDEQEQDDAREHSHSHVQGNAKAAPYSTHDGLPELSTQSGHKVTLL